MLDEIIFFVYHLRLFLFKLSDSNKYKFYYQILNKLGTGKKKIRVVVAKQLFFYFIYNLKIVLNCRMQENCGIFFLHDVF